VIPAFYELRIDLVPKMQRAGAVEPEAFTRLPPPGSMP